MQSEDFHEACDDQGPTLTFAKSEDGRVFGGFTSLSWQSEGNVQHDPHSFLFSITDQ